MARVWNSPRLGLTACATLWGCIGACVHLLGPDVTPAMVNTLRCTAAAVGCFIALVLTSRKGFILPDRRSILPLLLTAGTYGATTMLFSASLVGLDISTAYSLHYSVPLWVALILHSKGALRLTPIQSRLLAMLGIGVVCAFAGAGKISAACLALASGGTFALNILALQSLASGYRLLANFIGVSAVLLLNAGSLTTMPGDAHFVWIGVLGLGVVCSCLPLVLFSLSVSPKVSSIEVSLILNLELLVAGATDALLLGYIPTGITGVGFLCVLLAGPLFTIASVGIRSGNAHDSPNPARGSWHSLEANSYMA